MSVDEGMVGLAAGDGLGAMYELLRELILPSLRAPVDGEDGFWMPTNGVANLVVSADGYSVDPIEFSGGDIGRLAFCGIGNDLLASGARLRRLTISLFLSPELMRSQLRRVMQSVGTMASSFGVEVICGDTKVVSELKTGLLIAVTGIGEPISERRYDLRETLEGDEIVVTGNLGAHSIAVLSAREGLGFDSVVKSDASYLHDPIVGAFQRFGGGIHGARDLTRGGLVAGLWEGSMTTGRCWKFRHESIPIQHEVRGACELLDIDPMALTNEGVMMLTVHPSATESLIAYLRTFPQTSNTVSIGTVGAIDITGPRVLRLDPLSDTTCPAGLGKPRLC